MLGSAYDSFQEFKKACQAHRAGEELHSSYVLGKVYSSDQLRYIAREYCDITEDTINELLADVAKKGLGKRYDISNLIAERLSTSELGEILSRADHDMHFSVLSYFDLPNGFPCMSLREFVRNINAIYTDAITFSKDARSLFKEISYFLNGFTQPPGRAAELESILICQDTDIASLLYSCSRILVAPNGEPGDYNFYFLARIPVLVRLLFNYGLIEISMPTFAEPVGTTPHTERIPERYQRIVFQVNAKLQELIPISLNSIDYGKVSLYLETVLYAQDMGWHIAPQSTADFNLTQRLIPLRDIFDDFQESLAQACSRREMISPLAEINLYKVFRALKEQSYTYAFELNAPIGSRGGNFRVSALYGEQDSEHNPIFWVPKNNDNVAGSLREAIKLSRHTHVPNPYDLDALLG